LLEVNLTLFFLLQEATASLKNSQATKMRAPPAANRVRPSSGYYGNTFNARRDSDNESGCVSFAILPQHCNHFTFPTFQSLSSSSASSRNSIHIPSVDQTSTRNLNTPSTEDLQAPKKTGAIPKPSGLRAPSNLRAPQIRSGLPRPSAMPIRR
jgi:hypothetical protein